MYEWQDFRFLKDPLIPQNTGNRENIYLAAELCNGKRKDD